MQIPQIFSRLSERYHKLLAAFSLKKIKKNNNGSNCQNGWSLNDRHCFNAKSTCPLGPVVGQALKYWEDFKYPMLVCLFRDKYSHHAYTYEARTAKKCTLTSPAFKKKKRKKNTDPKVEIRNK